MKEYVIYRCDPNDEFKFIGEPLYKTDSIARAYDVLNSYNIIYHNYAFVIYQPRIRASRGAVGINTITEE